MTTTRVLRQLARRGALLTYRTKIELTGSASAALQAPGVTILLLHNTPAASLATLRRFIRRHRQLIIGYERAVMQCTEVLDIDRTPGIAFSFDDGFKSNLGAARLLSDEGIGGCFFIPTDVVGLDRPSVDEFFRRPQAEGVMTWDDLELLKTLGHSVGSHCRQHTPLSDLPDNAAEDQVKGSILELRKRLGTARHFAWPFGNLASAPAHKVVLWCKDVDAIAASGVRGRNTGARFSADGYLRRDAVENRWIGTDTRVFAERSASGRD